MMTLIVTIASVKFVIAECGLLVCLAVMLLMLRGMR